MPANFESGVFYGEPAWHGLGTTLDDNSPARKSVEQTIAAAGMDWEVEKYPMEIARAVSVPQEHQGREITDKFAVARKSDGQVFGIVGNGYTVLQNREMFQWFQPFLDAEVMEFETAGSLFGGRIVWVLARVCQDDMEVQQGDKVRPYILLSSGHDGLTPIRVGFNPVRVVCANTLAMAHNSSASNLFRLRHTPNHAVQMEKIRETMDVITAEFQATAEQYRRLAECGIDETQLRKYVKRVFDMPENNEEITTRTENKLQQIMAMAASGIGQDGELTAWSAYQGVTQYLSYESGRDQSRRLKSLWFRKNATVNQTALQLATDMLSA